MKLIDMTVTRAIPAPAEKVFDIWMDPKSPGLHCDRTPALDDEMGRKHEQGWAWILSMLAERF
jgi:hypothetical protein